MFTNHCVLYVKKVYVQFCMTKILVDALEIKNIVKKYSKSSQINRRYVILCRPAH